MKNVAFKRLLNYLDNEGYRYDVDPDKTQIYISFETKDFPIKSRIVIEEKPWTMVLYSHFPFEFKEDDIVKGAMAMAMINYSLADGCFDLNLNDGKVVYRISTNYPQSGELDINFVTYLLVNSNHVVDYYNDLLYMLSAGKMSLDEFHRKVEDFS